MKRKLRALAQKYENAEFVTNDPSQVLRRFAEPREQEIASFIAAQLSFGKRELFLAKLNSMFEEIERNSMKPSEWISSGKYENFFPKSENKFYRFFSYADMNALCARLAEILQENESLGEAIRKNYESSIEQKNSLSLVSALIAIFPKIKCVSQDASGACKKLHMFLRWMVRQNSPVDLGLWKWASAKDLLIPLDVHVMQEAAHLGLLSPKCSPSAKTTLILTRKMAQIWPDDPAKGDFALFGLGVDEEK
uniref:TIGR02757 family protein n=1 Tax=uncultured Spirochaetaceae bacterium TaxID=201186 RepID=A0A650EP57_9SPIO|nr:TIGR02757 family protein [uncultured Spirochaetaceae bacterium]